MVAFVCSQLNVTFACVIAASVRAWNGPCDCLLELESWSDYEYAHPSTIRHPEAYLDAAAVRLHAFRDLQNLIWSGGTQSG